ncbi:MAG: hypothetical protein WAO52_10225, partial [Prolixibacteraceae bacterium]
MRKYIITSGIIIVVAALTFVGYKYFPLKKEQPVIQIFSTKQNPAFKAVPQKSPLVFEVKNQVGFFNVINGKNPVIAELKSIPDFESLFSSLDRFQNFVTLHSGVAGLLKAKSVIVSVNPSGKNQLSNLFLVQMNDDNEANSAAPTVTAALGPEYTVSQRNYDKTIIYNARKEGFGFYYSCSDGIFMASEDFILVEEAIRQSKSANLLGNREFLETYKTIEETALVNVFINHLTIHQVLAKLLAPEIRKTISQLSGYSNWSGLDLSVNNSEMVFDGYSVTRDSSDNYLNVFRNQQAEKMTIDQVIPSNASYFVALNVKNTSIFIDSYESYLRAKGNFYPREMDLIEFQKKTKTDAVRLIKEIGGLQFAGIYTNINKSNPMQNRFFVAELKDQSDVQDKLDKAVSDFSRASKTSNDKLRTTFSAGAKKSFEIYNFPFGNLGESLFGRSFSGIKTDYFAVYENYLICGDNLTGMKNYLQSLVAGKTMANDSIYQVYQKGAQANPNFSLYAKIPKIFRLKDQFFKPELAAMLSKNEDIIRKYSAFSWQYSVSGSMIENRVVLKYDPTIKEEPQAVWQLKMDGQLAGTPKMVLNHKDLPNREVIVRDNQNNVSLINKEGLVLWTVNVPGEIVSDIHQIDIYRTNRFQYVFNTKTQLYVIDRNGNKVGKFPVTLKSMASNGVLVAEYGRNKEYRFMISGEDKQLYIFDRDGRLVPKVKFEGSESLVKYPIRHLELDDKDYIVFADQRNTYFLDRQGKSRELNPAPFDRSANPMVLVDSLNPKLISTDLAGKIYIQDFTGQQEIKEVGKFGSMHHFAAADLDGDGYPEYLFAEGKKLSVFASDGKLMFEKSFGDNISEAPLVCSFGKGITRIGVVVKGEN